MGAQPEPRHASPSLSYPAAKPTALGKVRPNACTGHGTRRGANAPRTTARMGGVAPSRRSNEIVTPCAVSGGSRKISGRRNRYIGNDLKRQASWRDCAINCRAASICSAGTACRAPVIKQIREARLRAVDNLA
jgi:hypothetical protein